MQPMAVTSPTGRMQSGYEKEVIEMNANKLRGKIVERGTNVETLAKEIGMDRATLYRKIKSLDKFTIGDARKIKTALDMSNEEAYEIFLS